MVTADGRREFHNSRFAAGWELFHTPIAKIPGKYPLAMLGMVGMVVAIFVTDVNHSPWFFIFSGFVMAIGFSLPVLFNTGQYAVWTRRRLK